MLNILSNDTNKLPCHSAHQRRRALFCPKPDYVLHISNGTISKFILEARTLYVMLCLLWGWYWSTGTV